MRKALFKIREKMRRREFILGTNTTFNDACVTELLGDCGFDFIWIDMEHTTITKDSAVQHLIACRHSAEETAKILGADSLGYLPLPSLVSLAGGCGYCSACFDGSYPTAVPKDTRKDRFEQKLSERKNEVQNGV